MDKPVNQKAWLLILPVVLCVAFSAILPLMTVVNYSVQDIISPGAARVRRHRVVQVGDARRRPARRAAAPDHLLARGAAVEIPLGIALALSMPAKGWKSSAVLVLVAISLLIPWNVVGTIWQIFGRADIGLLGAALAAARHRLQLHRQRHSTPGSPCCVMDVWHWTPLVALLCYAGLRSIPDAYYQAAQHRRRLASSRCSATSSCRSCAAC